MYLLYFDEVKFHAEKQPRYLLGGLMIDAALIPALETEVNALAQECFGTAQLRADTEFHAAHLFHRKSHFKQWDADKRVDVLCRLAKIIDRHDDIMKIMITINVKRMVAQSHEDKAFMFLVEKFQSKLASLGGYGMMIGDHEQSMVSPSTFNLSRYREDGTDFAFGTKIDRLIDTVHFTHSHHSRMLQLADVYLYATQMCATDCEASWTRKKFTEFVKTETRLLAPHKYKDWPSTQSWY